MAQSTAQVSVGSVGIQCPSCEITIAAPVFATVGNPDGAHDGEATLDLDSDMTELWAHMWTHDE